MFFGEKRRLPIVLLFSAAILVIGISVYSILAIHKINVGRSSKPPNLVIFKPQNGQVPDGTNRIVISGKTDPGCTVVINDLDVSVDEKGYFLVDFILVEGKNKFIVLANNDSGKSTKQLVFVDYTNGVAVATIPQSTTVSSNSPKPNSGSSSSYTSPYINTGSSSYSYPSGQSSTPNSIYTPPSYSPPSYTPPPTTPNDDSADKAFRENLKQQELSALDMQHQIELEQLYNWYVEQQQIINDDCNARGIYDSGIRLQRLADLEADYNHRVDYSNAQYQQGVAEILSRY